MTDAAIRRLGPGDAAAFRDIRLRALQDEPQNYASTYEDWVARPLSAFEDLLASVSFVAAEAGSDLVGICGWYPQAHATTCHRGTLIAVYVRPSWRRRGLFSQMMRAIIADAAGQVRQLELHVHANNLVAQAAYGAAGFAQVARIPDALNHSGVLSDELLMLRRIPA